MSPHHKLKSRKREFRASKPIQKFHAASCMVNFEINLIGGAEGNRTLDLLNAIQALSQLSYGPTEGRTR
jgi:hypothetical protein